MSSAFRRKGKVAASGSSPKATPRLAQGTSRGVKAWTGGIHLTSVGVQDLDAILGGGQPLGTCIVLQEDRWTRDLALSLVKYWVAEAISQEQSVIIPTAKQDDSLESLLKAVSVGESRQSIFPSSATIQDLILSLPRNLHWDKELKKQQQQQQQQGSAASSDVGLTILEEEEDEEENLEIAWQYKKSVQQERSGVTASLNATTSNSNVFCHSYDLSGRMVEQKTTLDPSKYMVPVETKDVPPNGAQARGFLIFRHCVKQIQAQQGKMTRLLLFHPDIEAMAVALPLLLAHIRSNGLSVVVLLCLPGSTPPGRTWTQIARSADVVLSTEGFASRKEYPPPAEFRHLQGLLKISKVSTVTAAAANGSGHYGDMTQTKRPAAFLYGFKRDRRKLHIPLLHIPPEDYTEGGGSVGSGARSGAGRVGSSNSNTMGCSSNTSGGSSGSSLFDF
eukprot:Nitzschia sp. Nitz4//scaffold323_size20210//8202//9623//NITZ4_008693-RA/size20210-snap-gene-0.2-mRNA-1//1//CDS//3329547870//4738//frame0